MKIKKKFIYLFILLVNSSCGDSKDALLGPIERESSLDGQSSNPTVRIKKLRWYNTQWKESWTHSLRTTIETSSIESIRLSFSDLKRLKCSSYNSLAARQKQDFWIIFIASIAASESGFNPKLRTYEPSLKEYSQGLLQLSLSDRPSHPNCRALTRESILKPRPNLHCGLGILIRQLRGSKRFRLPPGTLFPKKPYYWSVLTKSSSQIKVIDFFKLHLSQLSFCE